MKFNQNSRKFKFLNRHTFHILHVETIITKAIDSYNRFLLYPTSIIDVLLLFIKYTITSIVI